MKKAVREYLISLLGEGIHTAFRKIGQAKDSSEIWNRISKLPDEEWAAMIDFALDGIKDFINSKKVEASIKRDEELVAAAGKGR